MRDEELTWNGHRVSYRRGGGGPTVLLVHGIAGSCHTWDDVLEPLAEHCDVIAPDLLGHGQSAKPRGDYSLGAFATGLRDLLELLEVPTATVVGHSLGGGIAMQFAYQYPERCERLVLVSSGGLGKEVSGLLRAAALPGSGGVVSLLASNPILRTGERVGSFLRRLNVQISPSAKQMAQHVVSLNDPEARAAFVHTLRSVVDFTGQRVNATDRLYLAGQLPLLVVWGGRDRLIPARHAATVQRVVPTARVEVFTDAGHFPHCEQPARFAQLLLDFIATTDPVRLSSTALRELARQAGQREADRPVVPAG
jgi:pimeloyl-ACP methyl ester carboxylesterase